MSRREMERIENIIGKNRLNLSRQYTSLISYDLEKLLSDYFEIEGGVDIIVNQINNVYDISIKAKAIRVKTVTEVPKY